jgi:hypothetical protein
MFEDCRKFNQPLDKWTPMNATTMESMFRYCEKFNKNLLSWDDYLNLDVYHKNIFDGCFIKFSYKPALLI